MNWPPRIIGKRRTPANAVLECPTERHHCMRGTPSLVLIDKQGLVRKHTFGAGDDLRIGAEIGALIQESVKSASLARSSAA
jgi:hypothetical protein